MPIEFGPFWIDERVLLTMDEDERRVFFQRLAVRTAAAFKGRPAEEIAQAVANAGRVVGKTHSKERT